MEEAYDDVYDEYDVNDKLSKFPEGSEEYDLLDNGYFSHYISDNINTYANKCKEVNGIKVHYIPKTKKRVE